MIVTALPNERGRARVLCLNCRREGGRIHAAKVLSDGGSPAGDFPARLIYSTNREEHVTLRLPALEDGIYEGEVFEVIE